MIEATTSGQASGLLIIGGPGAGKSALLRALRHEAEKAGLVAPSIRAEKGEGEGDIAAKVFSELSGPGQPLAGAAAPKTLAELAQRLGKAADRGFGAVVIIDDMDRMRKPAEALSGIALALREGWGRRRVSFVMGSTAPLKAPDGIVATLALGPFEEHDARELIEKALGKGPPKMGEECLQSILADSGGNPRLLKTVCYEIYLRLRDGEKVISKGHYLAYLPQIMGSLSRDWFGRMFQETPAAERAVLLEMARSDGGMHVSDIAKKLRKPLGPVTALTLRLLSSGQIVRIDRGKYKVFSKLYGRYVLQRA